MIFLKLISRGIAGVRDCIIIVTLGLLFWFIFMSEFKYRYFMAGISCLDFLAAYLTYRIAEKVDDGI